MDTNQCNDDGSCDLWESCQGCEGTGEIWYSVQGYQEYLISCAVCEGTGKYIFGE